MVPASQYPQASAWLSIDLGALAANYNLFQSTVGSNCAVAGVIKANGYGLGVEKVLAALESQNCPYYFVATLEEAIQIRKLTTKPICVFGGLYHGAEDIYLHENIMPVLNSLEDIKRWKELTSRHGIMVPAILHFDTGMNRLGLGPAETSLLHDDPSLLDGLDIRYAITHFACADDKDHPMNEEQAARFDQATAPFPQIKKCLANSSGILRSTSYHHDMVRPGIGLYGGNPTPETNNPMKNVVSLHARILQVRDVSKEESIGYSATYRFDKNTKTATIALGYADGFLRSLSSNDQRLCSVYYNDTACPVIGRVSMDAITVDVGHLETPPRAGESMEILGKHRTVDDLANDAGTISYEILTDLGRRYHRVYTG